MDLLFKNLDTSPHLRHHLNAPTPRRGRGDTARSACCCCGERRKAITSGSRTGIPQTTRTSVEARVCGGACERGVAVRWCGNAVARRWEANTARDRGWGHWVGVSCRSGRNDRTGCRQEFFRRSFRRWIKVSQAKLGGRWNREEILFRQRDSGVVRGGWCRGFHSWRSLVCTF